MSAEEEERRFFASSLKAANSSSHVFSAGKIKDLTYYQRRKSGTSLLSSSQDQSSNSHQIQQRRGSLSSLVSLGSRAAASFVRRNSSSNDLKHFSLDDEELATIAQASGLDELIVEEKFIQFVSLCEEKPSKGLNERQFQNLYKRAFPNAINPLKLANSVFRLCDRNGDGVIDFAEFVASLCIPPTRISTYQKFCTLFLIWDYRRAGYLTLPALITALKDVYDILGLFSSSNDHHKDAMRLFGRMSADANRQSRNRHCRVYMRDFAGVMMTDAHMVKLMEGCNFCVPSPEVYMGQSIFWRSPSIKDP